jgi:hypothetical protein
LENLRFLITNEVTKNLEGPEVNALYVEGMKKLAYVLSPNRCGVYDELLSLIRTKVMHVDDRGIPVLTQDWWSHLDILILDDMWSKWGIRSDPKGTYGIADKIRKGLNRKWLRSDWGWALTPNKDDIIFEFEEFDEWRVAFEGKQQTRSEGVDGIGRFG